MATTILDDLKWYGGTKKSLPKQTVPTLEQLIAFGCDETGDTIESRYGYNPETDSLPEGRDNRVFNLESPGGSWITYVPDREGFYVENFRGTKWRPADLDDVRFLLEEMDHQVSRYGDLL